tara:strand:+ start:1301 stop:1645 length:345 start_codon:yes stop_codon:yes gene_type:complete
MSDEKKESKFVHPVSSGNMTTRQYNKLFHPELVKPLRKKAKTLTAEEVERRNAAADRLHQRRNGNLEFDLTEREIRLIEKWKEIVNTENAEDMRRFLRNRGVKIDEIGEEDETD